MVARWASPALSPQVLLTGTRAFRHGECLILWRVAGNLALVVGEPLGPPASRAAATNAFAGTVHKEGRTPVFLQVSGDHVTSTPGIRTWKIGEEAVIPLNGFSLSGNARKTLRQSRARLLRRGYTTRILELPIPDCTLDELAEVSRAWVRDKRLPEIRFGIGHFDRDWLRAHPTAVAFSPSGRMEAFATLTGSPESGTGGFDMLRYLPDAPSSVLEFLVTETLLAWQREGRHTASLGLAPLAGTGRGGRWLARAVSPLYAAPGLRRFKHKFGPRWEPRHAAAATPTATPSAVLPALRAFLF